LSHIFIPRRDLYQQFADQIELNQWFVIEKIKSTFKHLVEKYETDLLSSITNLDGRHTEPQSKAHPPRFMEQAIVLLNDLNDWIFKIMEFGRTSSIDKFVPVTDLKMTSQYMAAAVKKVKRLAFC
jgi:hypothetical protein